MAENASVNSAHRRQGQMLPYEPFQAHKSILRHKPVAVAHTGTGKVDEEHSSAVDFESSLYSSMTSSLS